MLEYLRIKNLALISDMELEFAPGLNVLTGETGAGKSFILKALNFLTGEKMGADMVRPGRDRATVEALFSRGGEETIIRREIASETGRSRIFLNDSLSSQETVRKLKQRLILHTSQHAQQRLLQPSFQARILDGFLKEPALVQERDRLLASLRELSAGRAECLERAKELEDKRELLEYQRTEIAKVAPEENEEQELEARRSELRDQAAAQEGVSEALSLIAGPDFSLADGLSRLDLVLENLRRALPEYAVHLEFVREAKDRLADVESQLRGQRITSSDGMSLEQIESRLFALAQLKRKLKRTLPEIVALNSEIGENLSFLDACGLDLKRLEKEELATASELAELLAKLNQARKSAAQELCASLVQELRGLGFSEHIEVSCEFSDHPLMEGRPDLPELVEERPRFMWLPNPGQPPQPLDKIASGGELSRFLLALTGLMARDALPTLLFDEVDSGVGGVTLTHVGERLRRLAGRQQTLLISHWPQLAALAERHFQVRKEVTDKETHTLCTQLSGDAIFAEISRMGGGGERGDAMARELLGK
ncbi:MAG: DNA repair protein RecN [Desulfovibrio sp.]|nr:MAG: DNA repair protein RecN [Desulfovibrio sp.]